jgi:RNA polymerase-binding transcription factor DksA
MEVINVGMSKDSDQQHRDRERSLLTDRARVSAELNAAVAKESGSTEQERAGDISAMPTHPADLGTDTMQSEMDAANVTRLSRELEHIDAELERLRAKS